METTCTTLPIMYLEKPELSGLPKVTQHISGRTKIHMLLFTAIMHPLTFTFYERCCVWNSLREDFIPSVSQER